MEFWKLLVQATGLIIGWAVVHWLSAKRDIDKARREMIVKATDSLADEITKLFSEAKSYHTKVRDFEVEDKIKMTLQDISMRITLLGKVSQDKFEIGTCSRVIVSLKQAITAEHFEDEHEGPLARSSSQIISITDEILRMKRALQELKQKQFPA